MQSYSSNTSTEVIRMTVNPFNTPIFPIKIIISEARIEPEEIFPSENIIFYSAFNKTYEFKNYETK